MKHKRITVVVAGNFYPIHEGHIDHIEKAKKLGDCLVVIIGNDDHLRRKGKPILLSAKNRARIVGALRDVDEVVVAIDRDGTCAETLRMLKPDIFAKGGGYSPETMPENEIKVCDEIGCRIVYGVGDRLNSSSEILRKLVANA